MIQSLKTFLQEILVDNYVGFMTDSIHDIRFNIVVCTVQMHDDDDDDRGMG